MTFEVVAWRTDCDLHAWYTYIGLLPPYMGEANHFSMLSCKNSGMR